MSDINLLLGLATIKRVIGNSHLQATAYAGEVRTVTHACNYGFANNPPLDTQALVVYPNADRAHGYAIAALDTTVRPELEAGAVAIYAKGGGIVRISPSGEITITAPNALTISAPTTTIDGNLVVSGTSNLQGAVTAGATIVATGSVAAAGFGGASGAPAAMSGGATITGSVTMTSGATITGAATLNGQPISTDNHTHTDAEGRPTSGAQS